MKTKLMGGVAAAVLLAAPATAQEAYPAFSGEIGIEVQHDYVTDADDTTLEGHDTYATVEPAFALALTEALRIEAGLTLEPVQDRDPDNDRLFDDHGVYMDTLQVVYEGEGFSVNGGKFTAPFGLAHDAVPGLYGDTFSEAYEVGERLGFGGAVALPVGDAMTLGLSAAVFKMDTTFLGKSLITDRGDLDTEDGGSGNTDGLGNWSATLAASDIAAVPGLVLQASYIHQGKGTGDAEDTSAWGLGAAFEREVAEGLTVAPMIEYVSADEALGVNEATYIDGATQSSLTAGLGFGYGNWSAAVAGGKRTADQPGTADVKDDFIQISAGYAFDNGIGVDLGWVSLEEGDQATTTVGAVVSYGIAF